MMTLAETTPHEWLGYDVINGIISDLYDRMLGDYRIWYYWKGHSHERTAAERRLFLDFVWAYAGGPVASSASDMNTAHEPLGIGQVEWWVFVDLAAEALEQSGLGDREKEELFFALSHSKAAIGVPEQAPSAPIGFAAPPQRLSPREKEVLRLVALGKNNSEIARELSISVNTVTRHLTNIFFKTGTTNRVQAAVYAARRRMV